MASSTGSPYVAGSGPGFDPKTPPDIAPPQHEEQRSGAPAGAGAEWTEEWDEDKLRSWLTNVGDGLHEAFGIADRDLAMTQKDLERIAPPLSRVLNRYEPTRAAAQFSDPAAVALGFGMYGWRTTLERVAAKRAREEHDAHGGAGVAFTGEHAVPGPEPNGDGPDVPDGYETYAERLQRTRQEEPEQ